jgi:hypothetical protein
VSSLTLNTSKTMSTDWSSVQGQNCIKYLIK